MIGPYETPFAFRMALEERLRNAALRQGIDLQRLRRRVAFERLLARLFVDKEPPCGGVRCAVDARLAGRTFALFHIDVGLGDPMLGEPAWVEGDSLLGFAGIPAVRIPVVPAAQQFAEKIPAFTFPWLDRDNTRVKDLVDLVLLVHSGLLQDTEVERALQATFQARATHPLKAELPKPPKAWSESFRALAIESRLPVQDLEQAYAYLQSFWHRHGLGQAKESGGEG